MPTHDAEGAVRRYLLFLEDPESLRDAEAIEKAQAAVDGATDPIDRLKAFAALDRAKAVDGSVLRLAFLAHAKEWAEAEGIPASAFREMGVPSADLVAAGLTSAGGSARPERDRPIRGRAPRLSLDEVTAKLPSVEFRLADLAAAVGREPATARNYLNQLVANGVVAVVGDDPGHRGKGKAPKLYVRV
jgi:hypothetical protein